VLTPLLRPRSCPVHLRLVLFVIAGLVLSVLAGGEPAAHAEATPVPMPAPAPIPSSGSVVDLYTIGPTSEFPSRFGHALLCARPAGDDRVETGVCYDYGVADRDDLAHVVWTSTRGVPSFVPVKVKEAAAIGFFRDQGREIEKQRLPLSAEESTRLVSALEDESTSRRPFAYHPYFANCSTKLRDHLDQATNGRLRPGPSVYPKGTFREYMEEGHSGHLDALTPMALYLGERSDRTPTAWEAMLLPSVLRDGVTERFGVAPEKLEERIAFVLPTSRTVGRMTLLVFGFLVFLSVRLAARRGRLGIATKIVGATLGGIALTIDLVAALATWPELTRNWALLLFLPTDLAIPFLGSRWLTLYLRMRLGVAVLVAVLEIAGIAHQPMLPLVVLVALPMAGLLAALRADDRARVGADEPRSRPATA
jgi:hypothetical protein